MAFGRSVAGGAAGRAGHRHLVATAVSLLGAAFIHLIWIAVTTASLWGAMALSVAFAVAVFVFV